ncbi:MAG: caspase domain-containing protein [bacterium]
MRLITHFATVLDRLAASLQRDDRVIIFFSGHGYTNDDFIDGSEHSYIIPYDATADKSSFISMDEINFLSEKLSIAKHQLFILDANVYGLSRPIDKRIDPARPDYLNQVSQGNSRQIITAGGEEEPVPDLGLADISIFTGQLLNALSGRADLNNDSYITLTEISNYIASSSLDSFYQLSPASGALPGHEFGEFLFKSPIQNHGEIKNMSPEIMDKIILRLKSANISFNVPDTMEVSEAWPVILLMSTGLSNDSLKSLITDIIQDETKIGNIFKDAVKITPKMESLEL